MVWARVTVSLCINQPLNHSLSCVHYIKETKENIVCFYMNLIIMYYCLRTFLFNLISTHFRLFFSEIWHSEVELMDNGCISFIPLCQVQPPRDATIHLFSPNLTLTVTFLIHIQLQQQNKQNCSEIKQSFTPIFIIGSFGMYVYSVSHSPWVQVTGKLYLIHYFRNW